MEHYLALFEPDLKAGGYTVTFPDFGSRLDQIEAAPAALGKRLHVEARDAA